MTISDRTKELIFKSKLISRDLAGLNLTNGFWIRQKIRTGIFLKAIEIHGHYRIQPG